MAEILKELDPPASAGSGGYAYSFQVTFRGARPFDVEGLAKLKVGGQDCDLDAGFERCELKVVRRERGRVVVVSARDLRGEQAIRADDGTEIAVKRRRRKKPENHLASALRDLDRFLRTVAETEAVTVVLG